MEVLILLIVICSTIENIWMIQHFIECQPLVLVLIRLQGGKSISQLSDFQSRKSFLHYIEISKIAMCMTQDKIENKILCTKLAMCMAQDKIENKILGTKIAICMTQDEI